jgi:hypothetical protein
MLAHTLSRASPSTALKEICLFTHFPPIGHISPLGTSPLPRLQSSFHPSLRVDLVSAGSNFAEVAEAIVLATAGAA